MTIDNDERSENADRTPADEVQNSLGEPEEFSTQRMIDQNQPILCVQDPLYVKHGSITFNDTLNEDQSTSVESSTKRTRGDAPEEQSESSEPPFKSHCYEANG